jgi:poly(glycerol-phosphate) alpha-glucosyltransferase
VWVDWVVAGLAADSGIDETVMVVESKQVGELLVAAPLDPLGDPLIDPVPRAYRIVHNTTNAHTAPPHAADSPIDDLWQGWFDVVDRFDAVLWLTEQQRADAVARFGEHPSWFVVPNPAYALPSFPDPSHRDPLRAVMVARLAPQKRLEDAVRAWPLVTAAVPGARLELWGGGPERPMLEELIAEVGAGASVTLMGHTDVVAGELVRAALLVVSSRYEGHPLAITEAFAAGTPVVAYDISYGPAEIVEDGVSGLLVPAGDVEALAAAAASILGDTERVSAMSRAAYDWARAHGPREVTEILAGVFRYVVGATAA